VNRLRFTPSRFVVFLSAAVLIASFVILIGAAQIPRPHISLVHDWTHQHLVYSQPTTWVSAWKMQQEPRYWQQKIRRGEIQHESERATRGEWARDFFRFPGTNPPGWGWHEHPREAPMERDWAQSLGKVGANVGSVGVPINGTTWYPVYPAKFSFDVNATPDCTNDYVVFPTNLTGATGGQASIIAYDKLYSGTAPSFCNSTTPAVYWSYNTNFNAAGTATTGTIATSPILSADGKKVAFIENNGGAGGVLHLLRWNAGDGGAVNTAIKPTIATSWTACPTTGACMISITFANTNADTASSPFYDYARDSLYAGDDQGVLHKFVNVFGLTGATPSESTSGWPINVEPTMPFVLTSPVLDGTSGNIFVADANGTVTYVRETFSSAGACAAGSPPCIGSKTLPPASSHVITDAPLVDPVTEKIFVFMSNYDNTNAAVIQSDTTLSTSVNATLGTKGLNHHLHVGAFDNAYLTGNGSAGRLYACASSATSLPTLQRIGFTNSGRTPASPFANPIGTMNGAIDTTPTLQVASMAVECAPLTEFFNTNAPAATQDQIFFGVTDHGVGAACSATVGCVMTVNITGNPATLTVASSIAEIGGPSGIIVDNNASTTPVTGTPQSSSLYFSNQGPSTAGAPCGTLAAGTGCAVKVTQAALQ
jgi:hypothetical protein